MLFDPRLKDNRDPLEIELAKEAQNKVIKTLIDEINQVSRPGKTRNKLHQKAMFWVKGQEKEMNDIRLNEKEAFKFAMIQKEVQKQAKEIFAF